jgi:hypothetical protein
VSKPPNQLMRLASFNQWRKDFVVEHRYNYYRLRIPAASTGVQVVVVPQTGDPDFYLSFDEPFPTKHAYAYAQAALRLLSPSPLPLPLSLPHIPTSTPYPYLHPLTPLPTPRMRLRLTCLGSHGILLDFVGRLVARALASCISPSPGVRCSVVCTLV